MLAAHNPSAKDTHLLNRFGNALLYHAQVINVSGHRIGTAEVESALVSLTDCLADTLNLGLRTEAWCSGRTAALFVASCTKVLLREQYALCRWGTRTAPRQPSLASSTP
jgi:hypothetical protein